MPASLSSGGVCDGRIVAVRVGCVTGVYVNVGVIGISGVGEAAALSGSGFVGPQLAASIERVIVKMIRFHLFSSITSIIEYTRK